LEIEMPARRKANVKGSKPVRTAGARESAVNEKTALELVLEMMPIPGVSGREGPIAEYITRRLRDAGVPASHIHTDQVYRKSPFGGEQGNLIVRLPGTLRGPRRLLMAHIDTVPLCEGSKPVLRGRQVRSGNAHTALGADNRAGAAIVLNTVLEILKRRRPHPPLTFFWPVQEEVGLNGARFVRLADLGRPKLAFNWDGGKPGDVTVGATGDYQIDIEVEGVASHAGTHPEKGVSAVAIAGGAIAALQADGWHGAIAKGRRRGTSNIGYVHGGEATNVVTDRVTLRAEARSHDPQFRKQIVTAYRRAFERAARELRSGDGRRGRVRLREALAYESYRLAENEPCVLEAERAAAAVGVPARRRVIDGGLDANWLTARRLPTVTLGCGQSGAHTVKEELDVDAYLNACGIALHLATATQ
jgi:tripeptide aminopeptidase